MAWDTLDTQPYCSNADLVTISSDGLTAFGTSTAFTDGLHGLAMSSTGKNSGLWCVEILCVVAAGNDSIGVSGAAGISRTSWTDTYGFLGGNGTADFQGQLGLGYRQDGDIDNDRLYLIGQYPLANWTPSWSAGDYVYVLMDLDHMMWWWRINGGPWLGLTDTGDPTIPTGGITLGITGFGPGAIPYFPAVSFEHGAKYTFNFGATPFQHAPPMGFTAGWTNDEAFTIGSFLTNGLGTYISSGGTETIVSPYIAPANGILSQLRSVVNSPDTTSSHCLIYDSDGPGGGPGTLLSSSTRAGSPDMRAFTATVDALDTNVPIIEGHKYYLGTIVESGSGILGAVGGIAPGLWIDTTPTWPNPNPTFNLSSTSNNHIPMLGEGMATYSGHAVGSSDVQGSSRGVAPQTGQNPTTLQAVIPSYLYVQYNDDDNLQAMVEAYNSYAQAYIDWFNALNLPIYTSDPVSGSLLDWVATNLYGYPRPGIPFAGSAGEGPYNTWEFNSLTINGCTLGTESSWTLATDDIYRRCLTWQFYKGDGHQFSISWLKRRIMRFVNAPNGTDVPVGTMTFPISVTFTGPRAATITLANTPIAAIFKHLVNAGILELPFQIVWTVTLT